MSGSSPWIYLIAGVLVGWVLAWLMELIFFRRRATEACLEEIEDLKAQIAARDEEIARLRGNLASLEAALTARDAELATLRLQVASLEAGPAQFEAPAVASRIAALPLADELVAELPADDEPLESLEGIGPTYAARLREAGVTNYARLARLTPLWLDDILNIPAWRRPRYEDWIAQAKLAAAGDEAGLKALQAKLFARPGDNLLLIDGVGPKAGAALYSAGILSFADLAATPPDQLEEIARGAGLRGFDVSAWIAEAQLRASGTRIPRARKIRETAIMISCPQDLSPVEGIGSVYERRLYAAGVGTFWELAHLDDDELQSILDSRAFRREDAHVIRASALKLARETEAENLAWDGTPPDDLELIEGIGEVYERRLMDAGICTFADLAGATSAQLDAICHVSGAARPDYDVWIAQARARAE